MTDETEVAQLLVKAANTFNNRRYLKVSWALQEEAVRELHSYGLLSIKAMAAIVECTEYRVRAALEGQALPRARGKLNPRHIPWLAYGLSMHEIKPHVLKQLLKEGTSLSTIAELTGISRATLNRWRK